MARRRNGIGTKVRFEVFKRDRFQCQYCGRTPPAVVLQLDHLVPHSKGGSDDESNLLTACEDCNAGKSDGDLREAPPPLAAQIERKRELSEQVAAYNEFLLELRQRQESQILDLGRYWFNQFSAEKDKWVLSQEGAQTIRKFLQELTPAEIMEAIDVAMGRFFPHGGVYDRTWRYFCGVCWRKIRRARGEEI